MNDVFFEKYLESYNDQVIENYNSSLMGGLGGIGLLFASIRQDSFILDEIIDKISCNEYTYASSTFSSGVAGFYWLLIYLNKKSLLEDSDISQLEFDFLKDEAIRYISRGNYDFLHGGIGIASVLLYGDKQIDNAKDYLFEFVNHLYAAFRLNMPAFIPYDFDFKKDQIKSNVINLGLSHGIPSVLKFCLQTYKQGINKKKSYEICNAIIVFLLQNADTKSLIYYPNFINRESDYNTKSRLAWCYGDLSVGYILYQAGICFSDKRIIDFSLELLYQTTTRKSLNDTLVVDSGLCHGSAGVGHIYNKLWHLTKDTIFHDSAEYWLNKAYDSISTQSSFGMYKRYNHIGEKWELDNSLLEGLAGILLALYSYHTGDFSWDNCLMLNTIPNE